jgi:hypothetical protein
VSSTTNSAQQICDRYVTHHPCTSGSQRRVALANWLDVGKVASPDHLLLMYKSFTRASARLSAAICVAQSDLTLRSV